MLKDFEQLGIKSVPQLAKQQPSKMYQRLQRLRGQRIDPCVLDTFEAAVAQARNPRLPAENVSGGIGAEEKVRIRQIAITNSAT